MTNYQRISLFALRLSLGWLFFYAGITKIFNPAWSAAGYLKGAKTFAMLFGWMLDPSVLPFINFMNAWGLALLGVSLLAGGLVRYSAYAGVLLMTLYYLAAMDFPYPNAHAFLVDEHVIYSVALLTLVAFDAGRIWGFDGWWASRRKMTKKA
ncbi:DoxX family protein [Patescibacteria group bacterium]|jgi:thiosulfate dehydrogenase [quinone] large subunit|nr:DoxX family protein [Patescibacteria group bacterium]